MKGARGGYTVVEVIIVLAVSTLIFVAAVTVFSGKQGKTEFAQAMRDVESQIQSVVNDVRVSTFPDASNKRCIIDPTNQRPVVIDGSQQLGTNENCVFLGKAIFINTNNNPDAPDQIRVYTVLGRRSSSSGVITSFSETRPEAIDGSPSTINLTETFTMPFGATVLSALQDAAPAGTATYLMGFYNSLHPTAGATGGSQSLETLGYIGIDRGSAGQVKNAIRDVPGGPYAGPYTVARSKVWTLCFQSGTSNERAQLIINASFAGVTTQVKYTNCS